MSRTFHISQQHHSLCRRRRRRCHSSHIGLSIQWEMNAVCLHLRVLFIRGTCVLSFIQPLFSMKLCAFASASACERARNGKRVSCMETFCVDVFHFYQIFGRFAPPLLPLYFGILRHSDRCMQFLILHFQLLLYSTNDNETTTWYIIYTKRCERKKQLLVYAYNDVCSAHQPTDNLQREAEEAAKRKEHVPFCLLCVCAVYVWILLLFFRSIVSICLFHFTFY